MDSSFSKTLSSIIGIKDRTLIRFALVGVVNTIVGAGTMFLLYNLVHCSYWFSSASNYIIGSIVSYFLNKSYTFRSKGNDWRTVLRFIINIAVCWLLAYGIAKPIVNQALAGQSLTIRENVSMAVGMVLFIGANYLGQKFYVFRFKDKDSSEHVPTSENQA